MIEIIKKLLSILLTLGIITGIFVLFTGLSVGGKKDFIKYAEFNVCYEALEKALDYDISSNREKEKVKIDWIEMLAFIGAKYGGDL